MDINSFATGGIQSGAGFYGGGLAGQRFDRKFAFQVKVNLNVAFYEIYSFSFSSNIICTTASSNYKSHLPGEL